MYLYLSSLTNSVNLFSYNVKWDKMVKLKLEGVIMFGERLKKARLARGWTQQQLGDRINLQRQSVYQLEQSDNPTSDVLLRCANALQVSTDYLLGLTDDPHSIASFTPDEMEAILLDSWRDPKIRPFLEALITFTQSQK